MITSIALQLMVSPHQLPKAILSSGLLGLGALVIFIIWVILLRQLIILAEGKSPVKRILVWFFLIPGVNLLWIPWALISGNGLIKKAQLRYIHSDILKQAMGVQILSVPILVLYLFWGVIVVVFHKGIAASLSQYEAALYLGIILISLFIVFGFYLVYLALFVRKLRSTRSQGRKRVNGY